MVVLIPYFIHSIKFLTTNVSTHIKVNPLGLHLRLLGQPLISINNPHLPMQVLGDLQHVYPLDN